jgi:hypothetical protein
MNFKILGIYTETHDSEKYSVLHLQNIETKDIHKFGIEEMPSCCVDIILDILVCSDHCPEYLSLEDYDPEDYGSSIPIEFDYKIELLKLDNQLEECLINEREYYIDKKNIDNINTVKNNSNFLYHIDSINVVNNSIDRECGIRFIRDGKTAFIIECVNYDCRSRKWFVSLFNEDIVCGVV